MIFSVFSVGSFFLFVSERNQMSLFALFFFSSFLLSFQSRGVHAHTGLKPLCVEDLSLPLRLLLSCSSSLAFLSGPLSFFLSNVFGFFCSFLLFSWAVVLALARSVWRGRIRIEREGVGASAESLDRVILLDEGAKCIAIPTLEIIPDDVIKVSHASLCPSIFPLPLFPCAVFP